MNQQRMTGSFVESNLTYQLAKPLGFILKITG